MSAAERLERIPPLVHGIWMTEAPHCRAHPTDESWLRIEPERINFSEGYGPVLAVVGSTWVHRLRLRVADVGASRGPAGRIERGFALLVQESPTAQET